MYFTLVFCSNFQHDIYVIISQGSDRFSSVINRLENIETPFSRFYSYDVERSVRVSFSIICYIYAFLVI